ncbi:MAG: DUF4180 domain-containing protein [Bacteroidales bacterium]|nr:DUF4180 domain-containing protein [Bacteroidales bacterium]
MEIKIFRHLGEQVAEISSETVIITNTLDALDLMADCQYRGAEIIILYANNLIPAFFDLKTGIAGDILQKFSTYRMKLAIIGDFSKYSSKSLNDFIYESNKGGQILFVASLNEALLKMK